MSRLGHESDSLLPDPGPHRPSIPHEVRLRFEFAWKGGQRPTINSYLAGVEGQDRLNVLRELVKLDLQYRWASGDKRTIADYLVDFPELCVHREILSELALHELAVRSRHGETPAASVSEESTGNDHDLLTPREPPGFQLNIPTLQTLATAELPQPRAFGRYLVRRRQGEGGFGTVYLGHDSQLQRPVAIKVPNRAQLRSEDAVNQFLQEARRLARLKHPGIVTVHDVGVQDGECYIVSDFVEGISLAEWLRGHRPSSDEAVRVVSARPLALNRCG